MAYVPQQISEDEKNQFARTAPTTPFPQGSGSSGSGANQAPGMGTPTQFGSNAAKLSDYLSANKEQVGEFGQQVAGNLTQGYNDAMGAVDQGFGTFNQDVSKGYTPPNQALVGQAAANPTEFVKNPDNVSQFKSQYNNQYKGPENFEGSNYYKDANAQVNKAVENAGMTSNFGGLSSYLQNFMGGANLTSGMQTLNTALLQRSPEASSAIKAAADPYKNLTGYLGDKTAQANSAVSQAKDTVNQSRQATQDQFVGANGLIPNLQNTLNSSLTSAQQNYPTQYNAALSAFSNGNLTPEQAKFLGFNTDDLNDKALMKQGKVADNLRDDYGIDTPLMNYFTTPDASVVYNNKNSVATPDQVAYEEALQQLTGVDAGLDPNSPVGYQNQIGINRQSLSELGPQINNLDQQEVMKYAAAMGVQPSWSFGQAIDVIKNNPARIPWMIRDAEKESPKAAQTLKNALTRMGIQIPGAPPPDDGGTPPIFHAL